MNKFKWYWNIKPLNDFLIFKADRIGERNIGTKLRDEYLKNQLLVDASGLSTFEKEYLFYELHRAYEFLLREIGNRPDPRFMKLFKIKPIKWSIENEIRLYIDLLMEEVKNK